MTMRYPWDGPLAPACQACREPGGTCFPDPCKLYQASVAGKTPRQIEAMKLRALASSRRKEAKRLRNIADATIDEAMRIEAQATDLEAAP
jgi:hypothetical protein